MSLRRRISAIESKSGAGKKRILVWREPAEAPDEAIRRHLLENPGDAGREFIVVGWADDVIPS
jgi:hypothetical protein